MSSLIKEMVLGYIFDKTTGKLILIIKNRPSYLAGKLNGIGGKIEPNETPVAAFIREVKEECNVDLTEDDVKDVGCFTKMDFDGEDSYIIYVYRAVIDFSKQDIKTMTDEEIGIYDQATIEEYPNKQIARMDEHARIFYQLSKLSIDRPNFFFNITE